MSDSDGIEVPENMFDPDQAEYHAALEQLRDVLLRVGYNVHKKKPNERTLRVYLGQGIKYPLLNPRASRTRHFLLLLWRWHFPL